MTLNVPRLALRLAMLASLPFTSPPAWAESDIGSNTTISAHGSVGQAVAVALLPGSYAHNVVGGVTVVPDQAAPPSHISASGSAGAVVAVSLFGIFGHPVNSIGGVIVGR